MAEREFVELVTEVRFFYSVPIKNTPNFSHYSQVPSSVVPKPSVGSIGSCSSAIWSGSIDKLLKVYLYLGKIMAHKDTDYIKSKINHMKNVLKMQAGVNPATGAAQPDWAKAEADYRTKNHNRIVKRRLLREKAFLQDEWCDND